MTSQTERTDFQEDLSQLVHRYQDDGLDDEAICESLRLQAEVVSLTGGS